MANKKNGTTEKPAEPRTGYAYEVYKNAHPKANPNNTHNGFYQYDFLGVAKCTEPENPTGPIDATDIDGIKEEFDTYDEFFSFVSQNHFIAILTRTATDEPAAG